MLGFTSPFFLLHKRELCNVVEANPAAQEQRCSVLCKGPLRGEHAFLVAAALTSVALVFFSRWLVYDAPCAYVR